MILYTQLNASQPRNHFLARFIIGIGFLAVAGILTIIFYSGFQTDRLPKLPTGSIATNHDYWSPMTLNLSISHPPALGEEATLLVSITSENIPTKTKDIDTLIQVHLPEGFELIPDPYLWNVEQRLSSDRPFCYEKGCPAFVQSWTTIVQSYQKYQFPLKVKAVRTGAWTITVLSKYPAAAQGEDDWEGNLQLLHLQVFDTYGKLGPRSIREERRELLPVNTR